MMSKLSLSLPQTPTKTTGMWTKYAYDVGGHILTLDEMEHGVLRANSGHPAKKEKMFKEGDERIKLCMKTRDCRSVLNRSLPSIDSCQFCVEFRIKPN